MVNSSVGVCTTTESSVGKSILSHSESTEKGSTNDEPGVEHPSGFGPGARPPGGELVDVIVACEVSLV